MKIRTLPVIPTKLIFYTKTAKQHWDTRNIDNPVQQNFLLSLFQSQLVSVFLCCCFGTWMLTFYKTNDRFVIYVHYLLSVSIFRSIPRALTIYNDFENETAAGNPPKKLLFYIEKRCHRSHLVSIFCRFSTWKLRNEIILEFLVKLLFRSFLDLNQIHLMMLCYN